MWGRVAGHEIVGFPADGVIFPDPTASCSRIAVHPITAQGFPGGASGKESAGQCRRYETGDMGSLPGWGRSPGGGNGNPLQYSCL